MDPNRTTDRILDDWDAVASTARPPSAAPRRRGSVGGLGSSLGLVAAGALAAALVVGVVALGGRISPGVGAVTPPPVASEAAVASVPGATPTATERPTASAAPHAPATPPPTARPTPTPVLACVSSHLRATITAWEGAAGSRIADVTVTNTGPGTCALPEPVGLDLIDGKGAKLMSGPGPSGPATALPAGSSATTLVEASNYCGPDPAPPVRIVFNLGHGEFVTASPASPTDATVPPCNGSTVQPSIQMQPWSR